MDSINAFDQFEDDLRSSLPEAEKKMQTSHSLAVPGSVPQDAISKDGVKIFDLKPKKTKPVKPVMNTPSYMNGGRGPLMAINGYANVMSGGTGFHAGNRGGMMGFGDAMGGGQEINQGGQCGMPHQVALESMMNTSPSLNTADPMDAPGQKNADDPSDHMLGGLLDSEIPVSSLDTPVDDTLEAFIDSNSHVPPPPSIPPPPAPPVSSVDDEEPVTQNNTPAEPLIVDGLDMFDSSSTSKAVPSQASAPLDELAIFDVPTAPDDAVATPDDELAIFGTAPLVPAESTIPVDDLGIFDSSPSAPGLENNSGDPVPSSTADALDLFVSSPAARPTLSGDDSGGTVNPSSSSTVECSATMPVAEPSVDATDDPFGLGIPQIVVEPDTSQAQSVKNSVEPLKVQKEQLHSGTCEDALPSGGETFTVKVSGANLGIILFFKPHDLVESLFSKTDKALVDALGERPVVSFLAEMGGFRDVGVQLGHVLLAVNGVKVNSPVDAQQLIMSGGHRTLEMSFYSPNTSVVVSEGHYMVKYDERTSMAPVKTSAWKPKYVVVGGVLGGNSQISMYRSRGEYEIAVQETFAGRPITVKVKQFGLHHGARIHNDQVRNIRYPNTHKAWQFFVVKIQGSNSVKIASSDPELDGGVAPVFDEIRRILMAQYQQVAHQDQRQGAWAYPE